MTLRLTRLRAGKPTSDSRTLAPSKDGAFRFRALPLGDWRLEALWEGRPLGVDAWANSVHGCSDFHGHSRFEDLTHDETERTWRIYLGFQVRIRVLDEKGDPVANPMLDRMGDHDQASNGLIVSWFPLTRGYQVPKSLTASGFARGTLPLFPPGRPIPPVEIRLLGEVVLTGVIRDWKGRPRGAFVQIHQSEDDECPRNLGFDRDCNGLGSHTWTDRTNPETGRFRIGGLPPTNKQRRILVGSWGRWSKGMEARDWSGLVDGSQTEFEFTLERK